MSEGKRNGAQAADIGLAAGAGSSAGAEAPADAKASAAKGAAPAGMPLSRRGFVAAGAASVAVACLGGAGVAFGREDRVQLRPPGAASELDLEARCNRCQRCVQACPRNVVQPLPLAAGLTSASTPGLIFRDDYCDFCGKCWEACPTGALTCDAPSASDVGVAKVVSDACVAWMWSGCTACEEACPIEGALAMDERGRPVVDEALCNGCGLCEMTCPSSSLRAYDPSVSERAICVVPRSSQAAAVPGAVTSAQLAEGRTRAMPKEAAHE